MSVQRISSLWPHLVVTDLVAMNYVGGKIIFELEFKDCVATVTKYVFAFGKITSPRDRDLLLQLKRKLQSLRIVKCNVEIMSDGKFVFF